MDASKTIRRLNAEYIGGQAQVSMASMARKACLVIDHVEVGDDDLPVLVASRAWRFESGVWRPMVRTRIGINGLHENGGMVRGTCDGGFDCEQRIDVVFVQKHSPRAWEMPKTRVMSIETAVKEAAREGRVLHLQSTFEEQTGLTRIPLVMLEDGRCWFMDPVPTFSAGHRTLVSVRLNTLSMRSDGRFRMSGNICLFASGICREISEAVGSGWSMRDVFENILPPPPRFETID